MTTFEAIAGQTRKPAARKREAERRARVLRAQHLVSRREMQAAKARLAARLASEKPSSETPHE